MESSKTVSPIKKWFINAPGDDEVREDNENKSQASCHISEDWYDNQGEDSESVKMNQESKIDCKERLLLQNEEIFSDFKNEAEASDIKSSYTKENELQNETTMLNLANVLAEERTIPMINRGLESSNETVGNEIPENRDNKSQGSCRVSEDSHGIQVKDSEGIKGNQESKIGCQERLLLQNEEIFSDFKNEAEANDTESSYTKENELQKETTMLEPQTTMLNLANVLTEGRTIPMINRGLESGNETVGNEIPENGENKSQGSCHVSEGSYDIQVQVSENIKVNRESKIGCQECLLLQNEETFSDFKNEAEVSVTKSSYTKENELQKETTMLEPQTTMLNMAKMLTQERTIALINKGLECGNETVGDEISEYSKNKSQDFCDISEDEHGIPVKDSENEIKRNRTFKINYKEFSPLQNEEMLSDVRKETEAGIVKSLNTKENELQAEASVVGGELPNTTSEVEILQIAKMFLSERQVSLLKRVLESELAEDSDVSESNENKSQDACRVSEDSPIPIKDSKSMKVNHESTTICKEFLSLHNAEIFSNFKNETGAAAAKPLNTEKDYLQVESTEHEVPNNAFNEEVLEMVKMIKISEEKISLIKTLLEFNDSLEVTEPKANMSANLPSAERKDSQYLPEECNFVKTDTEDVLKESGEESLLPFVLGSVVIGHVKASTSKASNTNLFTNNKLEIMESAVNENDQASKLEIEGTEQNDEHGRKDDSKFPSNVKPSSEVRRKKIKKKKRNKKGKK